MAKGKRLYVTIESDGRIVLAEPVLIPFDANKEKDLIQKIKEVIKDVLKT